MDIVIWLLILSLFILSFIGLIYPILPSLIFLLGGFIVYGVYYGFSHLDISFWIIEGILIIILLTVDHLANIIGVKKVGGSKAAIWGSIIGLMIGPFIIPFAGIIIGPFLGALIAEKLVYQKTWSQSLKIGFGSIIGLFTSILAKAFLHIVMIGYFLYIIN